MIAAEDLYKKLALQLERQLPCAAYRKPGSGKVVMLFQEDDTLHYIKDYSEQGFVCARFHSKTLPILIPAKNFVYCEDDKNKNRVRDAVPLPETNTARAAHLRLVSKGIEAIKKGQFEKVVLSRKEEIPLAQPEPVKIFKKLLNAYPEAFCYLWFHPAAGLWLGATPETLLKVEDHRFETMALAGTQKAEKNTTVHWGEKEKEEHQWVVDFITEHLRPFVRTLHVSDTYTAKAGPLFHLRTDISGTMQHSAYLQSVIQALHPTPAVCGYPKEAARQFILQHENYNRDFYTGFLGELNFSVPESRTATSSSLYVNLRCMQLKERSALIYVGGGITRESVPEKEWQETVHKAQTMRRVLHSG